eukprot:gene10763-biopygen8976
MAGGLLPEKGTREERRGGQRAGGDGAPPLLSPQVGYYVRIGRGKGTEVPGVGPLCWAVGK